jgi:hypothetical protein
VKSFRLMAAPAYKGFIARRYGPHQRYTIPRQSSMWWKMTSRQFVKWLERQAAART